MDLFLTLGTIEVFSTIVFVLLFGRKNYDFYTVWFMAYAIASGVALFAKMLSGAFTFPPSGNDMALLVFCGINAGITWLAMYFAAGKASESLPQRV